MPSLANVPVLVSRYRDGLFVATSLLVSDLEAFGVSPREAFDRLERHLEKLANQGRFWSPIRIVDATYQEYSVLVRVAERDKQRIVNFGPKIKIKVRCVFATGEQCETWCVLPDWDIRFVCDDNREPKSEVVELVRQHFANLSTDDLLRKMLPESTELRLARVRLIERGCLADQDFSPLDLVADPVSMRSRKAIAQTAWHRDQEVDRLVSQFGESSSTLLVGDSGCGKSLVIQTAALRYQEIERHRRQAQGIQETAPPLVWKTTASNLIAGMQYLGQWEERLEAVVEKLSELNAILFVDSLVELIRLGGKGPEDSIAAFILPYLRRNELCMVAEATYESLDSCRRLLPGFVEMFRVQPISRLTVEATEEIAGRIVREAKRNLRIEADDSCAKIAVSLYRRYLPYQSPPKGPVNLLSRLIAEARKSHTSELTSQRLLDRFTAETGLPSHLIRDCERIDTDELRRHFDREVIGQADATQVAVDTIVRLKAGMVDPKRPIATLMFCGPTGVGKTQLARSIADYVLAGRSDGGRLVRLDMSEYQSWDAVDRLLMTPQGEPAGWIQRLRTWPLAVVLLDEFEKAAPEVFDCLLSAFDEGRITDRFGRTTTLCGAIIVLTSNVGASRSASTGFIKDDSRRYARAIEQTFRPEFLNRLDSITIFQPLGQEAISQIVAKELSAINDRPAMRERGVELRWPDSLAAHLAQIGFDPSLGARPLQRAIEREVVAPLAKWLLNHADYRGAIEWEVELGGLTKV